MKPGFDRLCPNATDLVATFQCVQAANLNALKADIAQGKADIESGCTSKLDIAGIKQRGRDTLAARSFGAPAGSAASLASDL